MAIESTVDSAALSNLKDLFSAVRDAGESGKRVTVEYQEGRWTASTESGLTRFVKNLKSGGAYGRTADKQVKTAFQQLTAGLRTEELTCPNCQSVSSWSQAQGYHVGNLAKSFAQKFRAVDPSTLGQHHLSITTAGENTAPTQIPSQAPPAPLAPQPTERELQIREIQWGNVEYQTNFEGDTWENIVDRAIEKLQSRGSDVVLSQDDRLESIYNDVRNSAKAEIIKTGTFPQDTIDFAAELLLTANERFIATNPGDEPSAADKHQAEVDAVINARLPAALTQAQSEPLQQAYTQHLEALSQLDLSNTHQSASERVNSFWPSVTQIVRNDETLSWSNRPGGVLQKEWPSLVDNFTRIAEGGLRDPAAIFDAGKLSVADANLAFDRARGIIENAKTNALSERSVYNQVLTGAQRDYYEAAWSKALDLVENLRTHYVQKQ